ncbi:MAG: hypothetical protein WCF84_03410 [Anaerolineae bacterium]
MRLGISLLARRPARVGARDAAGTGCGTGSGARRGACGALVHAFYCAIDAYITRHHHAPSVREFCAAFNIRSTSNAAYYFDMLEAYALIEFERVGPRRPAHAGGLAGARPESQSALSA